LPPVLKKLRVPVPPAALNTVFESIEKLPLTFKTILAACTNVTVPPDTVKSVTLKFVPAAKVTVYVVPKVKNTESPATGTDAPPLPPAVVDQLVVLILFQVPLPPLQYRFAIFNAQSF
jgi:hypothetical protein